MSLLFVRQLEGELAEEISKLTRRVMNGQLSDREYVALTAAVAAYQKSIDKAKELLRKFDQGDEGEDEGDEGENVIVPAGGIKPRR